MEKSMKLLEIIELRSVKVNKNDLEKQLNNIIQDLIKAKEIQKIKIYKRLRVDSDFSIHMFHESDDIDGSGSPLGLRLVAVLKEYGLINHKIFIEFSNNDH